MELIANTDDYFTMHLKRSRPLHACFNYSELIFTLTELLKVQVLFDPDVHAFFLLCTAVKSQDPLNFSCTIEQLSGFKMTYLI